MDSRKKLANAIKEQNLPKFDPGFNTLPTQEAKKRIEQLMKTRPLVKKKWNLSFGSFP